MLLQGTQNQKIFANVCVHSSQNKLNLHRKTLQRAGNAQSLSLLSDLSCLYCFSSSLLAGFHSGSELRADIGLGALHMFSL
jgi:hypothetical protein